MRFKYTNNPIMFRIESIDITISECVNSFEIMFEVHQNGYLGM